MTALRDEFSIYYNEGLDMITVKNFDQVTIDELMKDKEIIIERRSGTTSKWSTVLNYNLMMRLTIPK